MPFTFFGILTPALYFAPMVNGFKRNDRTESSGTQLDDLSGIRTKRYNKDLWNRHV